MTYDNTNGSTSLRDGADGRLPTARTISLRTARDGADPDTIGLVVNGSLTQGLEIRLDDLVPPSEAVVGTYVTIDAGTRRFFGMIKDIELRTTIARLAQTPPGPNDDFLRDVYQGTAVFGVLHVQPMLQISNVDGEGCAPEPVKSVPPHFSRVRLSTQEEIERIFGREDGRHFVIGTPLDMKVKVRLDYKRFIERSNGVFGKSGTGKTFLTRLLLLNTIQKSNNQREKQDKAVCLIFDMHNEYGWKGTSEDDHREVPGLKQILGRDVAVYTLDRESSKLRNSFPDGEIVIGLDQIEPDDMKLLQETINLSGNALDACDALYERFQEEWFYKALNLQITEKGEEDPLSRELNIHAASIRNLKRALQKFKRGKDFIVDKARQDVLASLIKTLEDGRSVVIEFGRYGSDLDAYMLVANVLTRRIHDRWREKTEEALGNGAEHPIHLIIVIEEAHKFLDPAVAGRTIFGQIAREMRKYNVTLLVIDQRPSAIDPEVMSQFGTRITCLLDNERDIEAVLSGVSGKSGLRDVLARLDSKQQALILGHAVPMPIVVRPETYDLSTYTRFRQSLKSDPSDDSDLFIN